MPKALRIVSTGIWILILGCQILLAQGGTWTTEAPIPTPDVGLAVGVVDGILYAAGGDVPSSYCCGIIGTLEAYDPKTNKWTTKSPMPTPRADVAATELNGLLYVLGGTDGRTFLATVEAYDPKTNSWSTKAPMSVPRYGLAAVTLNGILYAVGGWNSTSGFLATVESYDPQTNTWTTRKPMATPRTGLVAAGVDGILYAAGGANARSYLATTEAYDPESNTWSTKAPMTTPRAGLAAGVVDGNIYMVGGIGGTLISVSSLSVTEAYDPKTNTWHSGAPMPTPRFNLGGGVIEDTFYAVGGDRTLPDGTGQLLATNEAFTPFLAVAIEIKPNTINVKSNGRIEVAVLSTNTFDATSVNPETVTLAGAPVSTEANGTPVFSFADVNGDGILDLVLTFRARDLQLTKTDTQVVLKGQTFAGQLIKGVASIRIVNINITPSRPEFDFHSRLVTRPNEPF